MKESYQAKETKNGGGGARIIDIWQRTPVVKRDKNMFRFATVAGRSGTMSERFLSELTDLAFNIDDLSERGDITISGVVEGRYLVITITSLSDGDVRRIVIPP